VKPWRQRRRRLEEGVIKDKRPSSKPPLRLTLLIPGDRVGMIRDEIILRGLGAPPLNGDANARFQTVILVLKDHTRSDICR